MCAEPAEAEEWARQLPTHVKPEPIEKFDLPSFKITAYAFCMSALPVRLPFLTGCLVAALAVAAAQAAVPSPAPEIKIDGLGKGTAPLSGPWQFHAGDDPAWAQPDFNDAAGANGWEQLSAEKTWGAQGHPWYVGYAWYRLHLQLNRSCLREIRPRSPLDSYIK